MKYSRNLVTGLILASVCGLGLQPLTVQAADTVVTGDNTQVVGAALYDEDLSGNTVTMPSGTANHIFAAFTMKGKATDNTVTIGVPGSSVKPEVTSTINGGESGLSDAISNKVYVYNSNVGTISSQLKPEDTIGKLAPAAEGIIVGGAANTFKLYVTLGKSMTDEEYYGGLAKQNEVHISDSTVGPNITSILGGLAEGQANNNRVTIEDSDVTLGNFYRHIGDQQKLVYGENSIAGGFGVNGADNNTITISNTTVDVGAVGELEYSDTMAGQYGVYGGVARGGTASNNILSITNQSNVENVRFLYAGSTNNPKRGPWEFPNSDGAASAGGAITDDLAKVSYANGNTLNVENSAISGNQMLMGGATGLTGANDNTVTMTNATVTGLTAFYGSEATGGETTGNDITITGGSMSGTDDEGWDFLGTISSKLSSDNTLTIKDAVISNPHAIVGNFDTTEPGNGYANPIVSNNTMTLSNTTINNVMGQITTAVSFQKSNYNTLAITGGNISYNDYAKLAQEYYYGLNLAAGTIIGYGTDTEASHNTLTVTDATITNLPALAGGDVFGDVSGAADDNTVTITGGSVDVGEIYGGYTTSGEALRNSVTMGEGIMAKKVYGGFVANEGNANKNTVTINGGTVEETVVAGTTPSGDVSGNTLNISGGTIGTTDAVDEEGNSIANGNLIAAGYTDSGSAADNTVNVTGGTLGEMMSLYGGYTPTKTASTGNTLNMYTKGNTVENLDYFQNLNFYVPEGTTAGETMIEVTNNADVSGADITAGVYNNTQIRPGQVINLIHDSANGVTTDENTTYSMMPDKDYVLTPGLVRYDVLIKKQDPETVVLYIPEDSKGTLIPATKLMTSQRNRAISTVTDVTDTASTSGYETAISAWNAEMGSHAGWEDHEVWKKYTPYVLLGGNDLRYDTDSTTNTQGFNSELGFVKRSYHDDYIDTYMPFLEYGNGNYTERYQGARGDGNQQYIGAGFLVRRDRTDGMHYEAVLRAGQLNTDYHADIAGHHISYDTDTNYIAAQLGLGKLYTHKDNDYDIYTKLFWSHLFSDNVDIYSDLGKAQYQFDSTDSVRSRIGFRWTKHYQENQTYYLGLGWDHEFDGTARATYNNFDLPEKDGKGDAGFLELGWSSQSHKDNPWNADVKLRGWVGMKKGIDYTLTIGRAF
ncbi:hypothetical protein [Megasphaera hominis]|uniref:Autotransporter domain-containing protein n=1 Tax=Megasphaera hominis TaxID=159836 RepID=A0ABR6VHB1_9FIRM|nr:hypothetical protein [Megasphaera hominis]MBC3536695.1 hypothetical protein [Megasphaera hominis]